MKRCLALVTAALVLATYGLAQNATGTIDGRVVDASTNAFVSSGVGSRPMRSRYSRRQSVAASASGDGAMPSHSSRARMNESIGFFTQSFAFTRGGLSSICNRFSPRFPLAVRHHIIAPMATRPS